MIKFDVSEQLDKLQKIIECAQYLATHKVDVGLTSSASGRSRFLLAIHTHGSPIMNIPARPVVQPALAQGSVKAEMTACMERACEAAKQGDLAGVIAAMEESGERGAAGIRGYIDAGISPPNAPVTLHGGWIYNPVAHKGVLVSGKKGATPLKDTGALYNDFDYEITGK